MDPCVRRPTHPKQIPNGWKRSGDHPIPPNPKATVNAGSMFLGPGTTRGNWAIGRPKTVNPRAQMEINSVTMFPAHPPTLTRAEHVSPNPPQGTASTPIVQPNQEKAAGTNSTTGDVLAILADTDEYVAFITNNSTLPISPTPLAPAPPSTQETEGGKRKKRTRRAGKKRNGGQRHGLMRMPRTRQAHPPNRRHREENNQEVANSDISDVINKKKKINRH